MTFQSFTSEFFPMRELRGWGDDYKVYEATVAQVRAISDKLKTPPCQTVVADSITTTISNSANRFATLIQFSPNGALNWYLVFNSSAVVTLRPSLNRMYVLNDTIFIELGYHRQFGVYTKNQVSTFVIGPIRNSTTSAGQILLSVSYEGVPSIVSCTDIN